MPRSRLWTGAAGGAVAAVAAGAFAIAFPPPALAAADDCGTRANDTHAMLAECITLDGVREHLVAFQEIADANHGMRVSGSPGHNASVDHVVERLEAAGYAPEVRSFVFPTFIAMSAAVLERVSTEPAGPVENTLLSYSGSGDVTAAVTVLRGPPDDPTPGCEAADFADLPAGDVALVSRGSCTFALKASNAYAAGASALVISNDTTGDINGTLGEGFALDIPVTSVTRAVGEQLAATEGLVLRVRTDTFRGPATTYNVLAETRSGDDTNVVMAGAHLDSASSGPGVNDNGSGAAALLEVAEQMARVSPVNTVRFAWWGGGESGLVGSTRYVTTLEEADRERIALYLDADTVGSPNHVFFVHDGDASDALGARAGPAGSDRIEKTFEGFFSGQGLRVKGADRSARSDSAAFVAAGIPSGGLFTGADGVKTAEEAEAWGGEAGAPYDPCHRRACDTVGNIGDVALDTNSDALGFAVLQFAMNTSDVNGVPGRADFPPVHPTSTPTSSVSSRG